MRTRLFLAVLIMTSAVTSASQAQPARDSGVRTETMERLAIQRDKNLPWNILGLLGLLGLLGFRRPHREDSYHPAPVE